MPDEKPLFDLNPLLDRDTLAVAYRRDARIQVAGLLTGDSAANLHEVLAQHTDWGLGWQAAGSPAGAIRGAALRALAPSARVELGTAAMAAAAAGQFSFLYARYPMIEAYLEGWDPGHPLDLLLEHINAPPMLDLVRQITGMPDLIKADAQATLFAPGHFLTTHDDSVDSEGRRVAYVLSMARDWRPDWGGNLLFTGPDDEFIAGYRPRFNALNLFSVPQRHHVTQVATYAPVGRFAVTGWFRDR